MDFAANRLVFMCTVNNASRIEPFLWACFMKWTYMFPSSVRLHNFLAIPSVGGLCYVLKIVVFFLRHINLGSII